MLEIVLCFLTPCLTRILTWRFYILHHWTLRLQLLEVFWDGALAFAWTFWVVVWPWRGKIKTCLYCLFHFLQIFTPPHEIIELYIFSTHFFFLTAFFLLSWMISCYYFLSAHFDFVWSFYFYHIVLGGFHVSIRRFRHRGSFIRFLLSSEEGHGFHMFGFTFGFILGSNFQFLSHFVFNSLILLPIIFLLALLDDLSGNEVLPIFPLEFRDGILLLIDWAGKGIVCCHFSYWNL